MNNRFEADEVIADAIKLVNKAQETPSLQPEIKSFFDNATNTITYVAHDLLTKMAVIIDSVLDYDAASGRTSHKSADMVIEYAKSNGLKVQWLLETHAHADHLSAAPYLQEQLGGKIAIGEHIQTVQNTFGTIFNESSEFERDGSQFDHLFSDGDRFKVGNLDVFALHVPGHTPADLAYIIGDAAFVGDTLFMPDYGTARVDFPGGDAATLYKSIRRLMTLPDQTRIFLCHDYKAPGRDEYLWETTVRAERLSNVHVHEDVSEEEFVAMRTARDETLDMPKLILPSIQVNIRGGHFPKPEGNGISYLKIPVDGV